MIGRKVPWRRYGLGVVLATVLAGALGGIARADTYGLVIGIDDYQNIRKLKGAVNDARGIADALNAAGARKVTVLTDAAATRAAIMKAWDDLLAVSHDDDVLVLTYAGHGGQEPERVKGSEDDGLDEVILLAGFAQSGPGTAERIPDDDIAVMLKRAEPRKVIFVADACHSGSMTRGIDPRAGGLQARFADYGPIENDALPLPTKEAMAAVDNDDQANVTYFGAVADNELAPEVYIDGKPHGALSWAFAKALRGGADHQGNGRISKGDLESFIQETVRMEVAGRQHPQVQPAGRGAEPLLSIKPEPEGDLGEPGRQPLTLRVLGGDGKTVAAALKGVTAVGTGDAARLVWDTANGDVIAAEGDVVASVPGKSDDPAVIAKLQTIVDKWKLVDWLTGVAERRSLTLSMQPNDKTYHRDDPATLQIAGLKQPYFTAIDLASDGTIAVLYPRTTDGFNDPLQIALDQPKRLELEAAPPFGADQFIVIASAAPLTDLHRQLALLEGQPAAAKLGPLLAAALKDKTTQIGWHGLFTTGP